MGVGDRRAGLLAALVVALLVGERAVHAGPPSGSEQDHPRSMTPAQSDRLRLIWRPASVAWPLEPLASADAPLAAGLARREAMLAGREVAPSIRGVVEIDSERAAAVWIAALGTVRVRRIAGSGPLRFIRVVDGNTAVLEPGQPATACPGHGPGAACWELQQPPSNGALWSIEADARSEVIIERVEPRSARYVAVEVEAELLEWIADDSPDSDMPRLLEPSGDLPAALRYEAALARELVRVGGDEAALARAITAWRMLGAMAAIDRERPAVRPYFAAERSGPLMLADTTATRLAVADSRDYRLAEAPRRWVLARKGPGQLRIAARSWSPAGQPLREAELRIYAGGRIVERIHLSPRQARRAVDPDTALPQLAPLVTSAGDPVGELATRTLVLAPGRRDYELELVGGPALLALEPSRRLEATGAALRGWTPRKRARAATRALQRSDSPTRPWLELLLLEHTHAAPTMSSADPGFDELARRSPLLASASLVIAAGSSSVDGDALAGLVARTLPWLAALDRDPDVDPGVRGQLRARWLELVALHDRPELAAAIVERDPNAHGDPIAELPLAGLRTLTELLTPTRLRERSPALALLELARRRAPHDEELRGQALRLWTDASRWSHCRPQPSETWSEWLIPRTLERDDPLDDYASSYLRLDSGEPARIHVEIADAATPRMRLIDVHVATPSGSRDPVLLRVDERRWWSPQLSSVQRHRVAVGPGEHELELDGPPGTVAWAGALVSSEHPTFTPERLGRRERMWPLAASTWTLPGPPVPGFVRLELRWPEHVPARPIRIRVIEDGVEPAAHQVTRTVLFDPRTPAAALDERVSPSIELDHEALPIGGSPRATARHDVTLAIAASTTSLRFEVEDDVAIAAAVSLRRGLQQRDLAPTRRPSSDELETLLGPLPTLDRAALIAEVAKCSRELLATPDALELRARRAAVLLLLGETGHARADLLRLSAYGERDDVPLARRQRALELLDELEQRFEALTEPREIVVAERERVATPALIEPAIAAVVGVERDLAEPWLDTWASVRTTELDAALAQVDMAVSELRAARADPRDASERARIDRDLELGALTRAHLLSRDPTRAREAARAWLTLYGRTPGPLARPREPIAIGLAAVAPLLAHLDDPQSDARDAGVALGLARELEPVFGHVSVRRLAFVAALRSDWSRLDHSQDNMGYEQLELPVAELVPSPTAEIREALLVAPWPGGESEQLRPGRKGVLAWDATPGSVRAQVWCRAARPDLAPTRSAVADRAAALGSAKLRLRLLDGGRKAETFELELADAELGVVELPIASPGRHQLELELSDDPIWLCSWRTETRTKNESTASLVEARRRAQWWTAESDHGVELIVLGPASLHVEARAVADPDPERSPTELIAKVERLDPRHQLPPEAPRTERGELPLARSIEQAVITESRRRFEVTNATAHTLLLTEPVAHRVRLTSDRGRVLIRARLRRDRGDLPPPARVSIHELHPPPPEPVDEFDWRGGSPSVPILARDTVTPVRNRIGTLDLRVRAGLDELGDVDDFELRPGLVASVGWRRALVERALWMSLAAETRLRNRSAPAAGGSLRLAARLAPLGVRLGADLAVLAQPFDGRAETSVRVLGFVDRPTWLGPYLRLRPGLSVGLRWQSLDPERLAAARTRLEPNPRIYLDYIHDHPILLRPELELRVYPLQDMAVWTEAQLVPNSDMRSLDHVNVELGTTGIARRPHPWVPTWGLNYQASPRFADLDRSAFFVRHRVGAQLGVAVWARDTARVAFGLTNQLFMSSVAPIRDVIELWFRVDAAFGRRMRDYGPREQWFREPWAPRAWGDDEHQSRSTYTPSQR